MILPAPVRLHVVRALALLAALAAVGCHRARPADQPSGRHAQLLQPDAPIWRERAPDTVRVRVETTKGPFVLEAYRAWAPHGVDRLYALVRSGYFDDSRFFRALPNYIVQFGIAGDPAVARVWRERFFPDDPVRASNVRGTLGYAMRRPDDRSTQVYINLADNSRNDTLGFAPFGRVVEGMDAVDRLYGGYAETSGGGVRAGRQDSLFARGNAYLDEKYPKLDRLLRATVIR